MKYTYRITLINKDEEEIIVYAFNYLEMITVITRVDPNFYHINVVEEDNTITVEDFMNVEEGVLETDFWKSVNNGLNDNPFGLN